MDDGAGQVSKLFSKLFKGTKKKSDEAVTENEILNILNAEDSDDIREDQKEMINNIFDFDDIEVRDVMTHRTEIIAVEINETLKEAVSEFIENGVSRLPVYEEDIDNIKGVLFAKDLLKLIFVDNPENYKISDFMREVRFVPETNRCSDLFKGLTARKIQLAVAVDEYGGTAGIVTMEDLLEAIVGNIQDEYDDESEEIVKVSDGVYEILGNVSPEDVAEKIGINIPEDNDFDTIGGFIINLFGRIPNDDETISVIYDGYEFSSNSIVDRRIEKIKAKKLIKEETEEDK